MKLFLLRWYGWSTRRTPHWVPSFLCAMQIIPKNQESEHGLGYINLTASNRLFLTTVLFYGWSVISTTSNLNREKEKGLTQLLLGQTTRTLVTAADNFLLSSWIPGALQQIVDIYTVGILSNLQPPDDIELNIFIFGWLIYFLEISDRPQINVPNYLLIFKAIRFFSIFI